MASLNLLDMGPPANREHNWLWLVTALFAGAVVWVNPLRETAMLDDWAYALTVRHLLETGEYKLHDWLSANMPFQAYWGGMFSSVFGYALSSLRLSTLVLSFLGLLAFYQLAREHDLDRSTASVLTLVLLSSPLVFRLSFSFMTDVPALTLFVMSLLLYTRGVRLGSFGLILLGSVVGAAAILTRQFCLVLVPGVLVATLTSRELRPLRKEVLAGLVLPTIAAAWQLQAGYFSPNWAATYSMENQAGYFADVAHMAGSIFWRPTVILQYMALFSLPLVPIVFVRVLSGFRASVGGPENRASSWDRLHAGIRVAIVVGLALYVAFGMLIGPFFGAMAHMIPYVPWYFGSIEGFGSVGRFFLSAITISGGVLYGYLFISRYLSSEQRRRISAPQRLLDFVTAFFFFEVLLFFQIGDAYLLPLLPFTLIVAGRALQPRMARFAKSAIAFSLIMLVLSAAWTRGLLADDEASWQAAERLVKQGVRPQEICAEWPWVSYYRFNEFLVEAGYPPALGVNRFFEEWLPQKRHEARFWITPDKNDPPGEHWRIVDEVPYRGIIGKMLRKYVKERVRNRSDTEMIKGKT
ncbi:MAG: glycosyltransferase family 39 protein [Thermodesulfobacteriota bacterium]